MKKMKQLLALLLAGASALTLAACGESATPAKPAATPTPETAYVSDFYTFPQTYSGADSGLDIRIVDEDGFLGLTSIKTGEREPEEGEEQEYEGQFDVYESRMARMDFEGKLTELAYRPMEIENADTTGMNDAGTWLVGLAKTDNGFLAIEDAYRSWNNAPETVDPESEEYYQYFQSEETYYLRQLDKDGREVKCVPMNTQEITDNGDYFNAYRLAVLSDGSVLTTGETSLFVFDVDTGEMKYSIPTDFDWIMNLLQTADGQVYVIGYGEGADGTSTVLRPVDAEKRSLGEAMKVEGDLFSAIPGNDRYLFYFSNGNNFFGYDAEKQEAVKLFNWLNVDVLTEDMDSYTVRADGSVVGLVTEWDKNSENATRTLVTIHEVPFESIPEKTVLTLATEYLDWTLRRELVRFNRSSDSVRIEVLDYSEYDNYEEDFDENGYGESGGLTKLRTEILAGNMPDIIDLNGMPTQQLAAKGLLIDLYPLLDADPELSREDIFPNVLRALETNGKLTSVSSGFYISTCIGASKVVGDKPGWTYEQLNEALAQMPEGCSVFGVSTTRDTVLQTMLELDMDEFVDWSTGKVSFDSDAFIALLNFCKEFPATFDWENHEWTEEDEDYNRIRSGQQLLLNYGLSGLDDIASYEQLFGGTDAFTFIGFPTTEGVGNLLRVNSGYGISRDCKDPQAAWDFLRVMLTEDYQDQNAWNIPTNKNVFEQRKKDATTPTYLRDAEGNIETDPETGEKLMDPKGWTYDPITYEESPIYFYTQEQVDKIEQVIVATERVPDSNKAILDIVREQTQAFFAGQRTAEEVAKLVQSKANIYVNEQR